MFLGEKIFENIARRFYMLDYCCMARTYAVTVYVRPEDSDEVNMTKLLAKSNKHNMSTLFAAWCRAYNNAPENVSLRNALTAAQTGRQMVSGSTGGKGTGDPPEGL